MSDKTDFNDLLPAIQAIPSDAITPLNMPVGIFIQEANDLYTWSLHDKKALLAAGLEQEWIDALLKRAAALSEAETRWRMEFKLREEAEQEWMEKSPAAFALRDEMLRYFRYAFRKNMQLSNIVSDIAEGSSNVDMLQDLKLLGALGQENLTPLERIGFDAAKLDLAVTTASELAALLASVNGERRIGNTDRILRDKAFTYLKQAVDEVRDCGKFVFFDNVERFKGYTSAYHSRRNRMSAEENTAQMA